MKKESRALAAVLLLFVCRAVIASVTVPPWQGPDEPTHFLLTRVLAMPGRGLWEVRPLVEKLVLQSMGEHRWWEPYGGRTPDPIPTNFDQINRLGTGTYAQPLYYGLGAIVLRGARTRGIEDAYWHLRAMSVVLGVAALAIGWAGTRLLFGPLVAIGATAIAALNPQFMLTAISVNPDALLIVLGSFIWWQTARLWTGHRPAMSRILIVITAVACLLTKRGAVPLVAVAAVIVVASLHRPAAWRITRRHVTWIAIFGAVGIAIMIGAWIAFEGPLAQLAALWRGALNRNRPVSQISLREVIEYGRLSIDYVWLVGGWLRFAAPEPWLWVARILTVTGLAGAATMLVRSPQLRRRWAIAWLFVAVQAAAIVGWGFLTLRSPQGRYLFPVIAPATALLWVGLTDVAPVRFKPYAAPLLIAILAVMDVTGFTTLLIPAYLPWG